MTLTGYIGSDFCTFTVNCRGDLIVTRPDGTEYKYNEENYDEDSLPTVLDMLHRDGVRQVFVCE